MTQTEISDLLVNLLGVIRDCCPCTNSFWDLLKGYYKKEKKIMNSPPRTIPMPTLDKRLKSRSPSPKNGDNSNKFKQSVGGKTGASLLSNYKKQV
jgi:hypothetical protein